MTYPTSPATAPGSVGTGKANLTTMPSEIVLTILHYLDIPDLYALTKTNVALRLTATDPLLHRQRLESAKQTIAAALPSRPTAPPPAPLFLTPQQATQRKLARKFVKLTLKRKLAARPDVGALIERGVMPAGAPTVAPALAGRAHNLEKERVKDALRGWVGARRGSLENIAEREGWDGVRPAGGDGEYRPRVRELARRYEGGRRRETRWGSGRCVRWDPPRAKVLGLRRFYERLAKGVKSSA